MTPIDRPAPPDWPARRAEAYRTARALGRLTLAALAMACVAWLIVVGMWIVVGP